MVEGERLKAAKLEMDRRRFLAGAAVGGLVLATNALTPSYARALVRSRSSQKRRPVVTIDAPRDGRDVTKRILRQISRAPDGAIIQFRPGRYRCEGSLIIQGRRGLTFRGPATIYATSLGPLDPRGMSQRRHFWFIGCTDITVRNLKVRSTNVKPDQREGFGSYLAQYEFEHGFAFHECQGVMVVRCSTVGTWGDGLYIGNQSPSRNVRVKDFSVSFNGRQGVALSNADDVVLDNVVISNTRRAGFDLEPSTSNWHVRNVEIKNSFVNGYHVAFAALGRGDVSNINIHHNSIQGPGVPWVYVKASDLTRRSNWRIADNIVLNGLGSPVAALRFGYVENVSIERNVSPVSTAQSQQCASFTDCLGLLQMQDNDFRPGGCVVHQERSTPVVMSSNKYGQSCTLARDPI